MDSRDVILTLVAFLTVWIVKTEGGDSSDDLPLDYNIVCLYNSKHYYMEKFKPSQIDSTLCTHLNYEFAKINPSNYEVIPGSQELDIDEKFFQEALDLRKNNSNLKVHLSIGGWEDSDKKYSEMATSAKTRKTFIDSVIAFLKKYSFDGMDLSWQYPNAWKGAIGIHPKDKENVVTLIKELKAALSSSKLCLSMSVSAIKRESDAAYNIPEIASTVDMINLMAYDMHGPWESATGHHTQFNKKHGDSDPNANVKSAVQVWLDGGADKKKINVGIAFYGKTFTLVDRKNHKLGAPAHGIGKPGPRTKQGGFIAYNEICEMLNEGKCTEEGDKDLGYYCYSNDFWACYDPPRMVVEKALYIKTEGLGGVFLKDMSCDDFKGKCFNMPFPLTAMIHAELKTKAKNHGS